MVMGKKSKIKGVNIIFQFFWHLFANSFAFPWEALHSLFFTQTFNIGGETIFQSVLLQANTKFLCECDTFVEVTKHKRIEL